MSGHSKWSKIKHQKVAGDAKRGQIFSKLSNLITVAAKKGGDPNMNLELKYALSQAKSANMPSANIERAIKKGLGEIQGKNLEEAQYEAFGPGGSALAVSAVTDNKNRTLNEIKQILKEHGAKLTAPGSTAWVMNNPINLSAEDKEKLEKLIIALKEHDDVQEVHNNLRH